jgi:hypothetical protein
MAKSLRKWWRNCAGEADSDISDIDKMEDRLAPLDPDVSKIRELISTLELCHHKAERWVENIIEAIGAGKTDKGLGTRPPASLHPAENIWLNACAALQAWCAGCPSKEIDLVIGTVPASQLLDCLGERSPLKEWQAQRVIDKIRSAIHWPQSSDDPTSQYVWILLGGGEYESFYRRDCPQQYKEHEEFWLKTVKTIVHDTVNGKKAELSLGLAIDMLMPCHWNFVSNLQLVLEAIGGDLHPVRAFAACGRNINLLPNRERMETISRTIRVFCGNTQINRGVDQEILALLGEPTETKKWLAASLDKTVRLQLDPPPELRKVCKLEGPDWIKQ